MYKRQKRYNATVGGQTDYVAGANIAGFEKVVDAMLAQGVLLSSEYQSLPPATRQAAMSAAEALAPEQSVDEVRESLSVTEKGQPANTIGNCRTVFCHDPLLRGAIRLNLLTDRVDIVRDLGWRRNTSALTDTDVKYLLLYFEQNYGLTSEKKMTAALSIVANENCYHPIQDVLNGLVWDGTPRIRSCLHHFLGAEVSDYVEEMLKHFLLGAIRRVFSPGSKYEEMLCLCLLYTSRCV